MNNTIIYAQTITILVAVTLVVHFGGGVDWPWAVATGAAASILLRTILPKRTPARH